jgi:hypothetical protein
MYRMSVEKSVSGAVTPPRCFGGTSRGDHENTRGFRCSGSRFIHHPRPFLSFSNDAYDINHHTKLSSPLATPHHPHRTQ